MKNTRLFFLIFLLFLGLFVRFYRFSSPIADWHSWRQSDTSAVSRNFVTYGFDILHPRFDDLSNVPSGKDNPLGYRYVEFPIYNVLQAGTFVLFDFFTLEQWGRLVTIFSSVLAGVFLYLLVRKYSNETAGIVTVSFFLFLPYNVYYGRTILPDTTMVTAILGGTYFFALWCEHHKKARLKNKEWTFYGLAILFTASAFLLKPYALFFSLPIVYLAWYYFGISCIKKWQIWVFAIVTIAPLWWWRSFMSQYPEGIPSNKWLLNGNGIRFRPAFFRWMVYERLIKLISGYVGILIIIFGVYQLKFQKNIGFFLSMIISSILYVVVFATGNVQHDYYQILVMPSVAVLFGLGAMYLLGFKKRLGSMRLGLVLLVLFSIGTFYYSWFLVRDYFNINNPSLAIAGRAVDRLTPKDAKIMALYNGDTTLLYQTNRRGWASFQKSIPEMYEMGARYIVVTNPTSDDMKMTEGNTIIEKTDRYLLIEIIPIKE